MTIEQFIYEYAPTIDLVIADRLHLEDCPEQTNRERELWVLNDEQLYNFAVEKGVDLT